VLRHKSFTELGRNGGRGRVDAAGGVVVMEKAPVMMKVARLPGAQKEEKQT